MQVPYLVPSTAEMPNCMLRPWILQELHCKVLDHEELCLRGSCWKEFTKFSTHFRLAQKSESRVLPSKLIEI